MAEKKGVGHAYNVDFLNVVFAASSLFLFLSVIWMVWDDFDREWKKKQREFSQLETQVTQASLQQAGRSVDKNKLAALTNVNLSEYFWVRMLKVGLPTSWFVREIVGILFVLFYVFALPVLLAKMAFKAYYVKLGAPRYYVTVVLFLMMMSLPIKMLARWLFNLKYIVAIPEFFFNI